MLSMLRRRTHHPRNPAAPEYAVGEYGRWMTLGLDEGGTELWHVGIYGVCAVYAVYATTGALTTRATRRRQSMPSANIGAG